MPSYNGENKLQSIKSSSYLFMNDVLSTIFSLLIILIIIIIIIIMIIKIIIMSVIKWSLEYELCFCTFRNRATPFKKYAIEIPAHLVDSIFSLYFDYL